MSPMIRVVFAGALMALALGTAQAQCAADVASRSKAGLSDCAAVTLEVTRSIRRTERGALAEAGIQLGEYLGDNRYLALLPAEVTAAQLRRDFAFISAFTPVAAMDKLAPELRQGKVPDYARSPDGRFKLHVELFESTDDEARAILARHTDAIEFSENAGAWKVEIAPDRLDALAAEPAVKRIDPVPDPRLL